VSNRRRFENAALGGARAGLTVMGWIFSYPKLNGKMTKKMATRGDGLQDATVHMNVQQWYTAVIVQNPMHLLAKPLSPNVAKEPVHSPPEKLPCFEDLEEGCEHH